MRKSVVVQGVPSERKAEVNWEVALAGMSGMLGVDLKTEFERKVEDAEWLVRWDESNGDSGGH